MEIVKKLLVIAFASIVSMTQLNAEVVKGNGGLQSGSVFDGGLDQHGSFTVNDLQSSPLLKSLFNMSVERTTNHLARVCILPQQDCKIVKDSDTINVVNSNGVVKFDN